MEVHVRSARLTDLESAMRILAPADDGDDRRGEVEFLRNLLFVPSATIVVAAAARQVIGVAVLAIRLSVRFGPFVGHIDELGVAGADSVAGSDRRQVADALVEHLVSSARNKGCTRVVVSAPLANAEPALWKRTGFASRETTLIRRVG